MSYPSYMPVEKHELHSVPSYLTAAPESQTSMSYTGVPYAENNDTVDNPDSKYDAEYSGMPRRIPRGSSRLSSSLDLLKALLLPTLTIAYLTFCYIVHYHVIPINMHGIINVSPQNIGEQIPHHIWRILPQAPVPSINQSWCNFYQHFNNRLKPMAIARFNPGSQSK
jgi:hypothetical protein